MDSNDNCLASLSKLLFHQHPPETLYWDATGKPGAGAYYGNHVWLGDYDECQKQENALYCLADLELQPNSFLDYLAQNQSIGLRWGLCAVKACNESTIATNIEAIFAGTLGLDSIQITDTTVNCSRHLDTSVGFHVTIAVLAISSFLCFLGTVVDIYHHYRVNRIPKLVHRIDASGSFLVNPDGSPDGDNPEVTSDPYSPDEALEEWNRPPDQQRLVTAFKQQPGRFVKFWRCFALSSNLKNLWSTSKSNTGIDSLHGIRVISMAWVVLGHTFLGAIRTKAIDDPSAIATYAQRWDGQLIISTYLAADTFFFISGLLVCFVTLRKMSENDEGRLCVLKLWLHRYLRLTPSVAFTMLLWIFILPRFTHGPLAYQLNPSSTCSEYWWTNLLYVQNFYPTHLEDVCMGWLWYLSIDLQLFVLSPVIICLICRSKTKGYITLAIGILSTVGVTAVLIGYYNIQVNLAASMLSVNGSETASVYEDVIYTKPYCRAAPYLVGMLLGYKLHVDGPTKRRFPKIWVCLGWMLCAGVLLGLVFGLYWTFHGHELRLTGNILYGSLSHLCWAAALSWIVYMCRHDYGGLVDTVLSWKGWEPFSKLTFGVYLLHPLFVYSYWNSAKTGIHITSYSGALAFCGFCTLSYVAAVFLYLLIERPILNAKNFILSKDTA